MSRNIFAPGCRPRVRKMETQSQSFCECSSYREGLASHLEYIIQDDIQELTPPHHGYPQMFSSDSFATINFIEQFCRRFGLLQVQRPNSDAPSFSVVSTFFTAVVDSLRSLHGRITLDIVQGDVTQELMRSRLREESLAPNRMPRKYTRMWLSNVP